MNIRPCVAQRHYSDAIAQREMLLDTEQKIARPRQVYLGADNRSYIPMELRSR